GIVLKNPDYATKFSELVQALSKTNRVAILIDEYDKPIIDYLSEIEKAKENREILKNLYGCLKGLDGHIKFLFITGVSKFSKVSIFSDLNHLSDITLSEDYSMMLGYTESEILHFFDAYLSVMETRNNWSRDKLMEEMSAYYNGYSWNLRNDRVYNPFSVLKFFSDKAFQNFWFATGTPTFLINALKDRRKLPEQIGNTLVGEAFFNKFDIENIDIVSLMFQTGYLTISKTNYKGAYWLDFPNREVEDSFMNQLLEGYSDNPLSTTTGVVEYIRFALEENDWAQITKQFSILFSNIPYQIFKAESEFYYHSIIHTVLTLMGVDIHSELQTSTGRIDTVIRNEKYVYVVEFKMGGADEALKQIKEMEYHKHWLNDKRQIVLVGIGFDKEKKQVSGFIAEKMN
ncbi:MAG: AAA family ATPase, partial [bacterium]